MSRYLLIERDFRKTTAEHTLEVVLDNGLHRHLRFRKPGTSVYGFDIVTWPGHLAVSGDMGAAVFTRLADMFEFFRHDLRPGEAPDVLHINASYWAEKCVANDGEKMQFEQHLLERVVRDTFDDYMQFQDADANGFAAARDELWQHIKNEVVESGDRDTRAALERMDSFVPGQDGSASIPVYPERYDGWFSDFRFTDVWEYGRSCEDYTYHFISRLYAIAHAVKAYDAAKAGNP